MMDALKLIPPKDPFYGNLLNESACLSIPTYSLFCYFTTVETEASRTS